jgi:hypothetical protein
MSRYNDINQLLDEIGTSDRSAGDPWTISSSNQGTVKRDSFSPAVVADLGAPAQDLASEMQSSEQIAKADEVVTSPTGSSGSGSSTSSDGSGILGGFLSLFPLASVVGKLFGLGGGSSPPSLTPYIQPPSVSFEGAMPGSLSNSTTSSLSGSGSTPKSFYGSQSGSSSSLAPGISSLSYGANGLPRTTKDMSQVASAPTATAHPDSSGNSSQEAMGQVSSLTSSTFRSEPAANGSVQPATVSQPDSSGNSSPDVMGQLSNLTSSNFNSQLAANSAVPSADLMATTSAQSSGSISSNSSTSGGPSTPGSGGSASSSQQGQSILVQVQAMDSQSFMDHSNDIAQAVRQAMLNLHSVNDVIADL